MNRIVFRCEECGEYFWIPRMKFRDRLCSYCALDSPTVDLDCNYNTGVWDWLLREEYGHFNVEYIVQKMCLWSKEDAICFCKV